MSAKLHHLDKRFAPVRFELTASLILSRGGLPFAYGAIFHQHHKTPPIVPHKTHMNKKSNQPPLEMACHNCFSSSYCSGISIPQCPRGESNSHAFRHKALNLACLPIPPPGQNSGLSQSRTEFSCSSDMR